MELLPAQALTTPPAATPDVGSISATSAGQAVPPHNGNPVKSSIFSDLRTLRKDVRIWESSVKISLPFSAANLSSGLSLLTSPTPDRPSALNSLRYSSTPHNPLPQNEVDKTQGTSMFSMSHRTAPGSSGHFWFLQVSFKYLEDNDSKTTCCWVSCCLWTSSLMLLMALLCTHLTRILLSRPLPYQQQDRGLGRISLVCRACF